MALVIVSVPNNVALTVEEIDVDTVTASDRVRELLAAGNTVAVVEGLPFALDVRNKCLNNGVRTLQLYEDDSEVAKVFTCTSEDFK